MTSVGEVYEKTRKRPDLFWNTYVCRPPASVVVYWLRDTPVTPNQVTLAAFAVAALSATLLVVLPGYWGALIAVVVFELSYVLDCVDGMLARWRGIQSTPGHLLDFLMDEIKAFLILAAVAVRLYLERGEDWPLLTGLAGLVALATGIAITTFQRRPEIAGPPPARPPAPSAPSLVRRLAAIPLGLAKWLVHYPSYILFAALLGRLELYFFPYVAVHALYALKSLAWVSLRFGRA